MMILGMEWYWWVIFLIGIGLIGTLKFKMWTKLKNKSTTKHNENED